MNFIEKENATLIPSVHIENRNPATQRPVVYTEENNKESSYLNIDIILMKMILEQRSGRTCTYDSVNHCVIISIRSKDTKLAIKV